MSELDITTNHVPRDLIDGYELTPKEREQFDYLNWEAIDAGTDSATFFRYKGELTCLDQVVRVEPGGELTDLGWDGCVGWSFSSGLVFRYARGTDFEQCIIGYYYVKG